MRLLITGINGFVGGHLAEQLLTSAAGEVWGLARQPVLALPELRGRVELVAADLSSHDQVVSTLASVQPDVIFHLAGQSNVPRSFADPAGTLLTNVLAQLHLFKAALRLKQNPLILIASSNEIYGQVAPDELPLNEDTPLRPVNPYAVSKATQDLLAYQYHVSHKLRTIRLRPFNHIGTRQRELFVASAFAAQIARIEAGIQEPLLRVGDLTAERDFTDVRDIARAYALAAQRGEVGRAYNIGSGRAVSIRRLLDTLLAFSERDIAVEPDPARMRPADVPCVVCDSRRFRERTGWAPKIPLEQTLHDILEYWRGQVRRKM
ncbi:MAG TPA: GDP-mannose 4,6-dehydratase [Roseiflexaceae bacterium]